AEMASVTLGQHPAQHHLDSDQQLFHKLKSSDRKKFTRKWSLDKIITRYRASDMDSRRAAVSASLALFNHDPPSASHSRGGSPRLAIDKLTQARSGVVKMRSEPLRREAWSIFNQRDPRVKAEKGEGHIFISRRLSQDWCDACNRQISSAALKCQNCSYTCHLECQGLVQLDCNQLDQPTEDVSTPTPQRSGTKDPQETVKEEDEKPTSLTKEEIKAKIDDYNSKVTENGMKLSSDGTYTGFIKVYLKLRRPVTVFSVDGKSPGPCSSSDSSDNRTSFYLPNDAVKQLHISSTTMVREVIQGLLKKFMVQDNPRKFALYRLTRRDSQGKRSSEDEIYFSIV
uniref:Ras association domain-containing protein 5-like n=1 Tax=Sinocyclocheilus anshuiensis TaxID=1608454 RepID=A0A671LPQ0_9TELE